MDEVQPCRVCDARPQDASGRAAMILYTNAIVETQEVGFHAWLDGKDLTDSVSLCLASQRRLQMTFRLMLSGGCFEGTPRWSICTS